jgi:hypothetical protein
MKKEGSIQRYKMDPRDKEDETKNAAGSKDVCLLSVLCVVR